MCGLLGRSENAKANQVGHCVSVSVCAAVREGMCVCVSYLKGKGVKGGETSAKGTGTKRSLASPASDVHCHQRHNVMLTWPGGLPA